MHRTYQNSNMTSIIKALNRTVTHTLLGLPVMKPKNGHTDAL